ncbi:MAG TPA: sulfide:quinone reductase [Campylobacterales bacterium]|nr:sulfide:quinone reductase [Campylobacterales bacterium]
MKKKILVLGGGFAGLESAIALSKEKNFEVTLVSNREYFYIYPISIWIPTREIEFKDSLIPLQKLADRNKFNLVIDEVVEIVGAENRVVLKNSGSMNYDYAVIAIGAGKMEHKGMEHTLSICGEPEEALEIQKELDILIAKGGGKIAMGFGGNPKDSSAVRGGPGFELFFNVHHKLSKLGIRDKFELTFFAPMAKPGARMGEGSLEKMNTMFKMLNLKSHYGKKIKEFQKNRVVFEDDTYLEADLIMYIPANNGHKNLIHSDLPLSEAGFIEINEYCEVKGFDNLYAVGDVAKIEGPNWRAKQGHIAEVMARNTAENIIIKENKLPHQPKSYIDHLNILCVMDTGNGAAFVYRDDKKSMMLPMPIVGHWLKKGWGLYAKLSKLGYIPRIPGM